MPDIIPSLWFNTEAEQAADFYVSLFPNSRVVEIKRYNGEFKDAYGIDEGTVLTVTFELDGRMFRGLNGGPDFTFNEAVSFVIDCADQAEVDRYWQGLIADGGAESQCGWLKDRFGLSWQVVPRRLQELMDDPDGERAGRATKAMLKMKKIDIAALEAAANGVGA